MADDELPDNACRPCRGTGRLISGLGGDPHEVTCPWCGGSGVFQPDRNAQETGTALRAGG